MLDDLLYTLVLLVKWLIAFTGISFPLLHYSL